MFDFRMLGELVFFALHLSDYGAFPKALTKEEEAALLERKMRGDKAAENELVERNLRLVAHIIKKYYAENGEQDDLISIGTIGLIKGVASFRPEKGTRLATYAARCIENEILMYFRSRAKHGSDVSLNDPIESDSDGNPLTVSDILSVEDCAADDMIKREDLAALRAALLKMPEGREKQLLTMRYGLDGRPPVTQEAVARELGISRSYVSRLETRALSRLREEMKKY